MKLKILSMSLSALMLAGCGGEEEESSSNSTNTKPLISIERTFEFSEPAAGSKISPIKVSLNNTVTKDVTVSYTVTPGSAASGKDFILESGEAVIEKGARYVDLPLNLLGDDIDEDLESFQIVIDTVKNAGVKEGYGSADVFIKDQDADPTISFESDFAQVGEGAGIYRIKVALSGPTERNVFLPFKTSGIATSGQDYVMLTTSPIAIPKNVSEFTIDVEVLSDAIPEGGESITIAMAQPDGIVLGEFPDLTLQIPGDISLNDTGVTTWFDGENYDGPVPDYQRPGQDAEFGLDAGDYEFFDGHAGFNFTKLDSAGNALPYYSESEKCVVDNRTWLTWELKEGEQLLPSMRGDALKDYLSSSTKSDSFSYEYQESNLFWRASNYRYYWYNQNSKNNGGGTGTQGEAMINQDYPISDLCAYPDKNLPNQNRTLNRCNTEIFSKGVSDEALCGFKDWRLPTIEELRSIYNYGTLDSIATEYFKNLGGGDYLSSTPSADGTGAVWCLNFSTGQAKLCNKQTPYFVRLVRGGLK